MTEPPRQFELPLVSVLFITHKRFDQVKPTVE